MPDKDLPPVAPDKPRPPVGPDDTVPFEDEENGKSSS